MDFGLKSLDDDQIVNLLEAILTELVTRDGYVRNVSQGAIFTFTEQVKAARTAIKEAIQCEKQRYISDLKLAIDHAVRKDVAEGKLKIIDLATENDVIVKTEVSTRTTLVREMRKVFMEAKQFTLSVTAGGIVMKVGNRCLNANLDQRTLEILSRLGTEIADALGSYPKWKYHPHLPARIVNTPEEEAALGSDWGSVGSTPPISTR